MEILRVREEPIFVLMWCNFNVVHHDVVVCFAGFFSFLIILYLAVLISYTLISVALPFVIFFSNRVASHSVLAYLQDMILNVKLFESVLETVSLTLGMCNLVVSPNLLKSNLRARHIVFC